MTLQYGHHKLEMHQYAYTLYTVNDFLHAIHFKTFYVSFITTNMYKLV